MVPDRLGPGARTANPTNPKGQTVDDIDREWEAADLADLIEGYEAMDQAEYAEFMGDLLDD